ncbi:MAG: ABC transporter ATP-binding protein [Tissierellia bacterium]|nr:ABC transporter ATP-binding protein [Tissierellia bacterium]
MKIFKDIAWFVKKNLWAYIFGVICLLLTYVVIPIPTYVIGRIVDGVESANLTRDLVIKLGAISFLSIVSLYLLGYFWRIFLFGNSMKFGRDNRRRIVKKLLRQNPEFYYQNSTGSLMSKATHDVENMQMLLGYGTLAFLEATVYPLVIITIMGLSVSWKLTFISIVFLPLLIFATAKLGRLLDSVFLKIQRGMEKLNESVLENVTSIRVIKGFSTQSITEKRFEEKARQLYDDQMTLAKYSAMFAPVFRIIPALSFVIAFLLGEKMMGQADLTLGQMVSFFMYLNMLNWPMMAFGDLINVWKESTTSIKKVQEIYDYEEDFVERSKLEDYQGGGDIEFKNFYFSYPGSKIYALEDINLLIEDGKTLGIVGKIGSGKTTLVKQLLRFYNVKKDTMLIDGIDIENFTRKSIRDKIGYVPQQHILFSKSVYDNIAFGLQEARPDQVDEAIEFADFTKDLNTLPNGLDTMIGEKGVSISGGQKQRISISRAIIKDPDILILDDSLSAVDALTEKNIIENIRSQRANKTTIIVAHRLSGLKHADKIIVLDKGRIVEEGSHEDLLKNKAWYYRQYESQRLGASDGR